MSVHDDGPAEWTNEVNQAANALLYDLTKAKKSITSLDFKVQLRERCANVDPQPRINQDDVSKYLKRWFLKNAKKDGYDYREHKVPAGSPGTVYNEYYWKADEKPNEKPDETAPEPEEKSWAKRATERLIKALKRW